MGPLIPPRLYKREGGDRRSKRLLSYFNRDSVVLLHLSCDFSRFLLHAGEDFRYLWFHLLCFFVFWVYFEKGVSVEKSVTPLLERLRVVFRRVLEKAFKPMLRMESLVDGELAW